MLIRPATADDRRHIVSLAEGERIKPTGLDWRRFIVADDAGRIVGAVQLRRHPDGSSELGSLVVSKPFRRRGIAARLIDRLIAGTEGRVYVITGAAWETYYRRWGFRRIRPGEAPPFVCVNYWVGQLGGGLLSRLSGRAPNPLAVLERGQADLST